MEFLQEENLSEQRLKVGDILQSINDHIDKLKEEKIIALDDISDDNLRLLTEKNVYSVRDILDVKLNRAGKLEAAEKIRLLHHRIILSLSAETMTDARRIAEESLSLAIDTKDEELIWSSNIDCFLVARYQGKLPDAEEFLDKAFKAAKSDNELQTCQIMKGDLLLARGKLNEGITDIFEPMLSTVADLRLRGLLLQKLGNACRSAARWGPAKDHLRKSIHIAQELNDKVAEFDRHGDLGNVYRSEGRISDALEHQWLQLKFCLNRGDLLGLTVSFFNIGFAYFSMKPQPNLDFGIVFCVLNNILATMTHNEPLRSISLNNLGKVFTAMEMHATSLPVFNKCLEINQKTGNLGGEGMAYGNIGTAFRALKRYDEAVTYHTKYRENARIRGDVGGMSIMQAQLTMDHMLKGNLGTAQQEVFNAIATNEHIRNQLGSEDSSKLANFEKNQADAYNMLQVILVRQGSYEKALALSEFARGRALADRICNKIKQKVGETKRWIWSDSMSVEQVLTDETVDVIIQDYIETSIKMNASFLVYSMVTDYDDTGKQQKWLYIWVVNPLESEDIQEKKKHIHFKRVKLSDSQSYVGFELDENFFAGLTRSFGKQNLEDAINPNEGSSSSSSIKVEEEEAKDEGVASTYEMKERVQSLLEILRNIKFTEESKSEALEDVAEEPMLASLRNLRIDGKDADVPHQRATRIQLSRNSETEAQRNLRILYEICIAPVAAALPKSEEVTPRLIIIPQEFLFSVPFCALQKSSGKYLVEEYVISYTPSLRALLLLEMRKEQLRKEQASEDFKVLSVGNPTMPINLVDQIRHAEEEAKVIQDIFGDENCYLLTRHEAKKDSVRALMPQVDLCHIASHAFPKDLTKSEEDGDYTMRGCILLAKSKDGCNGLLHAHEIEQTDNKLQMVMLSCCETGLGKLTGDGVVGLYRSFLASGSTTVVVTMWKIRDDVTPKIVKKFYEEYKLTHDAPAALRLAMIGIFAKQKLPPSQWAAFSIIGACSYI